jgi:hypothetical protein
MLLCYVLKENRLNRNGMNPSPHEIPIYLPTLSGANIYFHLSSSDDRHIGTIDDKRSKSKNVG